MDGWRSWIAGGVVICGVGGWAIAGRVKSGGPSARPAAPSFERGRVADPLPPVPATPAPPTAGFQGSVETISGATAGRMGASWRPGCPVPLSDLRLVKITYRSFDGQAREGEIVVHADVAGAVLTVFRELFDAGFPLHQVRLVDEFGGDDDRSMAANNTSGFNCRRATGSQRWSEHAYGRAIDVNPVQNPYVRRNGPVLPPAGAPFAQRGEFAPGLLTSSGPVVAAFTRAGWRWGGFWRSPDYQHFSVRGR